MFYSTMIRSYDPLCNRESNRISHKQICKLLLYCKFTLIKYNTNNTRFVGLEYLCNRRAVFIISIRNSLRHSLITKNV